MINSDDALWKGIVASADAVPEESEDTLAPLPQSDFTNSAYPQYEGTSTQLLSQLFQGTSILSLDISMNSTGVFCFHEDTPYSYNLPPLKYDKDSPHSEVLLRRSFLPALLPTLPTRVFEYIALEDSFSGRNHTTARNLYALNTAVDEGILDGVLTTEHFCRVNNASWKRTLTSDYPHLKRYSAKKLVTEALSLLPWSATLTCEDFLRSLNPATKGIQDRRDSFGIAVHTLSKSTRALDDTPTAPALQPRDLEILFLGIDLESTYDLPGVSWNFKPSVPVILRELADKQFIYNAKPVTLGLLHKYLVNPEEVPSLLTPGYFLFYVKGSL